MLTVKALIEVLDNENRSGKRKYPVSTSGSA
jgi:hypothetical protein